MKATVAVVLSLTLCAGSAILGRAVCVGASVNFVRGQRRWSHRLLCPLRAHLLLTERCILTQRPDP